MRTIDEIITNTQKATEEALREAFEAGRIQATSDLKSKMTSFFDSLVHGTEAPQESHPAPIHEEAHPAPSDGQHSHDGDHHPDQSHY